MKVVKIRRDGVKQTYHVKPKNKPKPQTYQIEWGDKLHYITKETYENLLENFGFKKNDPYAGLPAKKILTNRKIKITEFDYFLHN